MGNVLRKTPGCSHRRHPQRKTLAHSSLERAKRTLPSVSAENHQDNRVAQPSYRMEGKRRFTHSRKPLQLRLFIDDNQVDTVAATSAMVSDGQQTVAIGWQIDARGC